MTIISQNRNHVKRKNINKYQKITSILLSLKYSNHKKNTFPPTKYNIHRLTLQNKSAKKETAASPFLL